MRVEGGKGVYLGVWAFAVKLLAYLKDFGKFHMYRNHVQPLANCSHV